MSIAEFHVRHTPAGKGRKVQFHTAPMSDAELSVLLKQIAIAPDLAEAVLPFGDLTGEGDAEYGDDVLATVSFGRTTARLKLGDLRKLQVASGAAQAASE